MNKLIFGIQCFLIVYSSNCQHSLGFSFVAGGVNNSFYEKELKLEQDNLNSLNFTHTVSGTFSYEIDLKRKNSLIFNIGFGVNHLMFDYEPLENEFSAISISYPFISLNCLWGKKIWKRYDNYFKIKYGPSFLLTPVGPGKSVFGIKTEERIFEYNYSNPEICFGYNINFEYYFKNLIASRRYKFKPSIGFSHDAHVNNSINLLASYSFFCRFVIMFSK